MREKLCVLEHEPDPAPIGGKEDIGVVLSRTILPRSGRVRPAIRLMVIDLPEPERPNKAVIPASFSKATSRWKLLSFKATLTVIMRLGRVPASMCWGGYSTFD
jgi:hypothetical protein